MRKYKHILIFFLLITTTVVINGGTRGKCSIKIETPRFIKKAVVQGFPDLISFANYINQ